MYQHLNFFQRRQNNKFNTMRTLFPKPREKKWKTQSERAHCEHKIAGIKLEQVGELKKKNNDHSSSLK